MANQKMKTRIVHKHALESDWLKAKNFIPLQGELIIYDIEIDNEGNILTLPEDRETPYTYERFKIGDGITLLHALPFTTSQVQIIESNTTETLSALKIYKVSQAEYDDALANNTLEENAIYLTPDEEIDLSPYETIVNAAAKLAEAKTYTDDAVAQKSQIQIITWEEND